jgi:hypothetical protein
VAAHARNLDELRAFIEKNDLLRIPPRETLTVEPMPAFKRGSSAAEYLAPGILEKRKGWKATYYVDPIDPTWPPERVESYLRGQNTYEVQLVAAHEAYPGHHTQFAYARESLNPLRATLWNAPMVEGWAVYGEGLMVGRGWGGAKNDRFRFYDLRGQMIVATNAILDIKLQSGQMSDAEAVRFMVEEGFQEKAMAEKKLLRAKLDSTQLVQYFLGYDEIRALERDYRQQVGDSTASACSTRRWSATARSPSSCCGGSCLRRRNDGSRRCFAKGAARRGPGGSRPRLFVLGEGPTRRRRTRGRRRGRRRRARGRGRGGEAGGAPRARGGRRRRRVRPARARRARGRCSCGRRPPSRHRHDRGGRHQPSAAAAPERRRLRGRGPVHVRLLRRRPRHLLRPELREPLRLMRDRRLRGGRRGQGVRPQRVRRTARAPLRQPHLSRPDEPPLRGDRGPLPGRDLRDQELRLLLNHLQGLGHAAAGPAAHLPGRVLPREARSHLAARAHGRPRRRSLRLRGDRTPVRSRAALRVRRGMPVTDGRTRR